MYMIYNCSLCYNDYNYIFYWHWEDADIGTYDHLYDGDISYWLVPGTHTDDYFNRGD